MSKYEAEVNAREKAGEEKIRAVEEILKQTEEDADKVSHQDGQSRKYSSRQRRMRTR